MPNNSTNQPNSVRNANGTPKNPEDGSKSLDRIETSAEHAVAHVLGAKGPQVEDFVYDGLGSVQPALQAATANMTHERIEEAARSAVANVKNVPERIEEAASSAVTAVKNAPERIEEAARSAVTSAKEGALHLKDEGVALLHNVEEAAADAYASVREHAIEIAHDASDVAHHASEATTEYARRTAEATRLAGQSTARFVGTHALPLAVVGVGLGWLAWSVRTDLRRPQLAPQKRMQGASLAKTNTPSMRTPSAQTTSGAKLMGVRAAEAK